MYCPSCGKRVNVSEVRTCPSCGRMMNDDESYCRTCGTFVTGGKEYRAQYDPDTHNNGGKNAVFAAILSLIWPGLGQVYAGNAAKGIVMMFLMPFVLLFVFTFLLVLGGFGLFLGLVIIFGYYIYAIVDAYKIAESN